MGLKHVLIKNRLTGTDDRFGDILPEKMDDHVVVCILKDKREHLYYAEDIIDALTKMLNRAA